MSNFSRYLLFALVLSIFGGCAVRGTPGDADAGPEYSAIPFIALRDSSTEDSAIVEASSAPHKLGSYPFANPVGRASGDLGDNYPNPSVLRINGISITGDAGVGYLITATGDSGATWQPPALATQPTGSGLWRSLDGGLQAATLHGTAGQFATENGSATDVSFVSCSQDAVCSTSTPGAVDIIQLTGNLGNLPVGAALEGFSDAGLIEAVGNVVMPSDANLVLSAAQVRSPILRFTSTPTLTATRTITLPSTTGTFYSIFNGTTGTQALTFSAGSGGTVTIPRGLKTIIYEDGTGYVPMVMIAGGDLTASSSLTQTVTGIYNHAVSDAGPATNNALIWNGTFWAPAVVPLAGITGGSAGQFLTENAAATAPVWSTCSGDVSCSTGTPGQFTVSKVNGTTYPAGGSLTTGNSAYVTGVSATTYEALNLGGGAGWITGSLPLANFTGGTAGQILTENAAATAPVWSTCSGDETCSAATPGVQTVVSISGATPIPLGSAASGTYELQFGKGTTPLIDTAVQTTDTAPPTTTISGAGSEPTAATHISGGNLVLKGGINSQQVTGAGTVAATNGLPTIVGTSTSFGNQLAYGLPIVISGVGYTVLSVQSATALTLTTNYAGTTASGLTYTTPAGGPGEIVLQTSPVGNNGTASSYVVQQYGSSTIMTMGQTPGLGSGTLSFDIWGPGITPAGNNVSFGTNSSATTLGHPSIIEMIVNGGNVFSFATSGIISVTSILEFAQATSAPFITQLSHSTDIGGTQTLTVHAQSAFGTSNANGAGTIAVNNGSAAVVGTSTTFTTSNFVGQVLTIVSVPYTILSITDATHLTLTATYAGTNATGLTYQASNNPYVGVGTIGATNGTPNIVGTSTTFTTSTFANQVINILDSGTSTFVPYTILSITDATHLTLSTNYTGTTNTGLAYTEQIANPNGAPLLLSGGRPSSPGVLGLNGPARFCLGASSSQCGMEWAEPTVGSFVVALGQNGSGITATQMPSGTGNDVYWLGNASTAPTVGTNPVGGAELYVTAGSMTAISPTGAITTLNPGGGGSVNTELQQYLMQSGNKRITTSSAATIVTLAEATSATSFEIEGKVVCRATVAPTGGSIGDSFSANIDALFNNISGSLTQIGTTSTLASHASTSDTTAAATFAVSGTNILFQIAGPTGASAGTHDCYGVAWNLID